MGRHDLDDVATTLDVVDVLTHEFATPLSVMTIAVEALQGRSFSLDDDAREETIAALDRQVATLRDLLERLRQLREMETTGLFADVGRVDLGELVTCVAADLNMLPGRTVIVDAPTGSLIATGNRAATSQILFQLLNNAARHGEGHPVTITLARVGQGLEIRVRDHGDGVPEDQVQHLFAPYFRGPETGHHGLGIGLTLGRGLAQAQGGTLVHQAPEDGWGAVFVLTLPGELSMPSSAAAG